MPRLSVILPVYNGAATLARALQSIADQSHPADEVVVINDGSTDTTAEVIAAWADRLPLAVIENDPNMGLIRSLQRGTAIATGDHFVRLDADDVWRPDHLAHLVALKRRAPEAVLLAGRAELRREDGSVLGKSAAPSDEDVRAQMMWDNPLVHSAVAMEAAAYRSVGGYTGPRFAEDYDLWIRLLRHGSFACTDKVSVTYIVSDTSVSRINRQKALGIRLALQRRALRAFARRHPARALRTLPLVLARQCANRLGIA
ncbi:MAG: glycosyltransferase [Pseudomonadota bacterium]